MVQSDWTESLTRPSCTASGASLLLGIWVAILSIVNLTIGAYSPDHKVLWIGYLTDGVSNTTEMGFVLDDALFAAIGIVLIAFGYIGLNKVKEDGAISAITGFPKSEFVGDLFSTENGAINTLGSWLFALGITFYFGWSIPNNTWVDPGVYAVMIVLVTFGYGLRLQQKSE